MTHPLVTQLRFARSEFVRCLEGVTDEDARHCIMPMNCISWMVGHMAAQEQYYFIYFPQGEVPHPQLNKLVGFGHPATTPLWLKCGRPGTTSPQLQIHSWIH